MQIFRTVLFLTPLLTLPLVSHATGPCGLYDPKHPESNPTFCDCMTDKVVKGCSSQPFHPQCTADILKGTIREIGGATACHRWPPPGIIDGQECADDLNNWANYC